MNNSASLVDSIIKDEMNGTPRHELLVLLGQTPDILQTHAGFPNLQLAITGKVIGKACFDHGVSTTLLKRLEDIIHKPKGIFKSANSKQTDSVVVLTYEIKGVHPIIIPIRHSQRVGREDTYNLITSIYGKEGPDPEKKWTNDGLKYGEGNI